VPASEPEPQPEPDPPAPAEPGPGAQDPPPAAAQTPLPTLTPEPIGPELGAQGPPVAPAIVKVRPELVVSAVTLGRQGRRLTVSGRAAAQALGALSLTLSARTARRTVTVVTGRRLSGGRFVVHLDLPRAARSFRSLRVRVRFAGSDRVWPGTASMVLVAAR
jgi:hypothetical protein